MNSRLLLFLLITFMFSPVCLLFSQDIVEGRVVDSEDKRPVHGAVITYGIEKKQTVTSDANGKFLIPDQSDDMLKIQCLGYETVTIKLSILKKDKIIVLTLSPFSLPPVEIDSDAARKLVQRAIYNTKSKMITGKYMTYIAHYTKSEQISGEKRDFYFKYAALQTKIQPKKTIIPFDIWLLDIKHKEILPDSVTSQILKLKTGKSEFHINNISDNFANRYVTSSISDNNSIIKLEVYPGQKSRITFKNVYLINAADTTLISVQDESIPYRLKSLPYQFTYYRNVSHKLLEMSSGIYFLREGDRIYFSESNYTYIYSYKVRDKEEIISTFLDNKFMNMQDSLAVKGLKKIRNDAKELYEMGNSSDNTASQ